MGILDSLCFDGITLSIGMKHSNPAARRSFPYYSLPSGHPPRSAHISERSLESYEHGICAVPASRASQEFLVRDFYPH